MNVPVRTLTRQAAYAERVVDMVVGILESSSQTIPATPKRECGSADNDGGPKLSAYQQHRLRLLNGYPGATYLPNGRLLGWQSYNGNFTYATAADLALLKIVGVGE